MSWWTKNRKALLPAAGLLALQFIPGVGQAVSGALGSVMGGLGFGAGAGGVGGGTAVGAGGVASGILGTGTSTAGTGLAGGLSAPLIPGSTIPAATGTGLGTTAAPMAAPSSFMNSGLLAKSSPAALETMSQAPSMFAKGMKGLGDGAEAYGKTMGMMNALGMNQQQPAPPPPRPQAMPSQPMPNFGGYGQRQSPYPTGMQALGGGMDEMTKQRLRAMGYQV